MNTTPALHVAFAFDNNYLNLTYVLLTSVFENNKGEHFKFHAIANKVQEQSKKEIEQFVTKHNSLISFYDESKFDLNLLPIHKNSHLTVTTYCRLFFASLVPTDVKKLIYLDVDIVVIGSLREMCQIDMNGKAVGAVVDFGERTYPLLGIYQPHQYFNAGVLLIDVDSWKAQQVTERTLAFIAENPDKLRLGDQDAMNAVLVNQWHKLPPKYNVTTLDIPKLLSKRQYQSYLADKVIIHYTMGKHKPWRFLNKNKLRFLYYRYLYLSPVKNKEKYIDFSMKPSILYRFLKIRAEEQLMEHPKILKIVKKAKII